MFLWIMPYYLWIIIHYLRITHYKLCWYYRERLSLVLLPIDNTDEPFSLPDQSRWHICYHFLENFPSFFFHFVDSFRIHLSKATWNTWLRSFIYDGLLYPNIKEVKYMRQLCNRRVQDRQQLLEMSYFSSNLQS